MAYFTHITPQKCEHLRESSLTTLSKRTPTPLLCYFLCFFVFLHKNHHSLYVFICYYCISSAISMGIENFSCLLLYSQYLEYRGYLKIFVG